MYDECQPMKLHIVFDGWRHENCAAFDREEFRCTIRLLILDLDAGIGDVQLKDVEMLVRLLPRFRVGHRELEMVFGKIEEILCGEAPIVHLERPLGRHPALLVLVARFSDELERPAPEEL